MNRHRSTGASGLPDIRVRLSVPMYQRVYCLGICEPELRREWQKLTAASSLLIGCCALPQINNVRAKKGYKLAVAVHAHHELRQTFARACLLHPSSTVSQCKCRRQSQSVLFMSIRFNSRTRFICTPTRHSSPHECNIRRALAFERQTV